jgi:dienelactone hydrolase
MVIFAQAPEQRRTFHRVANPRSPAQIEGVENVEIPSLITNVFDASDWHNHKRKQLEKQWVQILGKVEPAEEDRKYFYPVPPARIVQKEETERYTRIHLELGLERDFWQPSLLLIPHGSGPFPAVIAWTSTSPDWREPEKWWGAWLAERGFVVLTGWSHIRNYRDGTSYRNGVSEKVYDRFGRWSGMGRMVWDVRQQARFLAGRQDVDARRIAFMGFSLSAKTAVYAGAFVPELAAVVAVDPHIALNGGTNYFAPWYLDWTRPFEDIPTKEKTVLSLLDTDKSKPGLEHDHHELLAMAAPKPFLLIGGAGDKLDTGGDSDDQQSWGYVNAAREVYKFVGALNELEFVLTTDGHRANGPEIDKAWQAWLLRWLSRRR